MRWGATSTHCCRACAEPAERHPCASVQGLQPHQLHHTPPSACAHPRPPCPPIPLLLRTGRHPVSGQPCVLGVLLMRHVAGGTLGKLIQDVRRGDAPLLGECEALALLTKAAWGTSELQLSDMIHGWVRGWCVHLSQVPLPALQQLALSHVVGHG